MNVPAVIRVNLASASGTLADARISPLQYGQFIEYVGDLVPGMWAELLEDGGFDGLGPGRWRYPFIEQTDHRQRPWYPCGQVNRLRWSHEVVEPADAATCARLEAMGDTRCVVGLAQDGLAVAAGQRLRFTGIARGDGVERMTLELRSRRTLLASVSLAVGREWTELACELAPDADCEDATFAATFAGPGVLRLDHCSLMPADHVGGWRRDVVEAVRALRPGIIRYGGNTVDPMKDPAIGGRDWTDLVLPPRQRKAFTAWGIPQPAGAGLHEILRFIREVGAEPMLCVRVQQRTPADAAAQVEYFNGAVSTPMGRLRAVHGHPEPYAIRCWQIGNEISGQRYEQILPEFCRAMRSADPSISLVTSYPTPGVISGSGALIDFVSPHHYGISDIAATERDLARDASLCAGAPRRIRLAITEWNVTATDPGPARAALWTLRAALACARYRNLLHRRCDVVEIAARSNLVNSLCAGAVQTDQRGLFLTPTYHVDRLYAELAGDRPLSVHGPDGSPLDVGATWRAAPRSLLTLFVVNPTLEAHCAQVDLGGFAVPGGHACTWTLADRERASEPDAANSFLDPLRIAPTMGRARLDGDRLGYDFPALSLSVMQMPAAIRP